MNWLEQVRLEERFGRHVSRIGHAGTGDVEIRIQKAADLERARAAVNPQLPRRLSRPADSRFTLVGRLNASARIVYLGSLAHRQDGPILTGPSAIANLLPLIGQHFLGRGIRITSCALTQAQSAVRFG